MPKIRRILLYSFLLLSPLAFSKFVYNYTIFKLILPQIFFLFIALTFLIEKKKFQYHKPLTILLSLYLLFNILSFLINPFHHLSYPQMMKLLTYFSIFLIAVNLEKDKGIFFFLFASGALLSFWAISDFFKFGLVNAGFGNKNFFAGYIIFLIPLSLSFIFSRGRMNPTRGLDKSSPYIKKFRYEKIIFLSLFLLYSFALFLTKSQAAYLAAAASILFLFILYSRDRKIVLIKIFFILFSIFLISFGRVIPPSAGTATTNFYFVDKITENVRFIVWRGTINMIKVHPLLGFGPGTFSTHYSNYRIPEYFLQKAVAPITAHSHCEYLEILAETGIFGLFPFILFIFFIFKEGLKYYPPFYPLPSREGKIGEGERPIIIGLLSGILAILVDNLLSTNLRQSFTPILLFFGMGLVVSYLTRSVIPVETGILDSHLRGNDSRGNFAPRNDICNYKSFSKKVSFSIFLLFLLFLSLANFNTMRKDVVAGLYLKKSLEARLKKDFPTAILYYKKTISVDRFNLIAYYKLAFAYGVLKKYDLALSTYKKLYLLSPHYAKVDKNMAVLYYEKKNLDLSLYYFRKAEKLNPYDVDTLCSIVSIFLIRKELQKARFYLKRAVLLDPKNPYALRWLKEIGK